MALRKTTKIERDLTDDLIGSLRPARGPSGEAKRREVFDSQQRGLLLRVNPSGKKSWRLHAMRQGKYHRVVLGDYNCSVLGVERARLAAALKLQDLMQGVDLAAARKRELEEKRIAANKAKAPTVSALLDTYEKCVRDELPKTWQPQKKEMLAFAQPVCAINLGDTAVKKLEALITKARDDGKPSTARHQKAYWSRPLRWASKQGWVDEAKFDSLWRNLTFRGHNQGYTPRERHLSVDELRALYRATDRVAGVHSAVYKALLLTGQRLSAVSQARWNEFDSERGIWVIPASRMKHLGRDHHIPLVGEFATLIGTLREYADNEMVFPSPEKATVIKDWQRAHSRLVADMLIQGFDVEHFTRHDIRRSVATLSEELEFMSPAVIDRWLAHKSLRRESVSSVYGVYSKSRRVEAIERGMAALSDWFAENE
jgi:integrase